MRTVPVQNSMTLLSTNGSSNSVQVPVHRTEIMNMQRKQRPKKFRLNQMGMLPEMHSQGYRMFHQHLSTIAAGILSRIDACSLNMMVG